MAPCFVIFVALVASAVAFPFPDPQGGIAVARPGANGSYAKDQYFQYANVPSENVFEWGYRRGNDPTHFREEYLSQRDHTFKAKLKWGDGYEGQGESFWDYNHVQRYEEPPSYGPPAPVYSPPAPTRVKKTPKFL